MTSPTSNFTFVVFEEPSGPRWGKYDYCIRLRDAETNHHADLMYEHGQDSFVMLTDDDISKEKSDKLAVAAFCYLSVIVK